MRRGIMERTQRPRCETELAEKRNRAIFEANLVRSVLEIGGRPLPGGGAARSKMAAHKSTLTANPKELTAKSHPINTPLRSEDRVDAQWAAYRGTQSSIGQVVMQHIVTNHSCPNETEHSTRAAILLTNRITALSPHDLATATVAADEAHRGRSYRTVAKFEVEAARGSHRLKVM
jgi:hypothetical protein